MSYRLTDEDGLRVCQALTDAPISFVFGDVRLLGGAERLLPGLEIGSSIELQLEPGEVFGPERRRIRVKRPTGITAAALQPGAAVVASVDGNEKIVWIRETHDDELTVETGDPLAGRRLFLEIEVLDVWNPETLAESDRE